MKTIFFALLISLFFSVNLRERYFAQKPEIKENIPKETRKKLSRPSLFEILLPNIPQKENKKNVQKERPEKHPNFGLKKYMPKRRPIINRMPFKKERLGFDFKMKSFRPMFEHKMKLHGKPGFQHKMRPFGKPEFEH